MTNDEIRIGMAVVEFGDNHSVKLIAHPGPEHYRWGDGRIPTPDYLTDANACLRVLDKEGSFIVDRTRLADDGKEYRVSLRRWEAIGYGATFCLAACEAVLRAHGKWRE